MVRERCTEVVRPMKNGNEQALDCHGYFFVDKSSEYERNAEIINAKCPRRLPTQIQEQNLDASDPLSVISFVFAF